MRTFYYQGKKCYGAQTAADIIGIKVRTIRDWISRGKLSAVKAPGSHRWLVDENEIVRARDNKHANKN